MKRKALGRGLSALIPSATASQVVESQSVVTVSIHTIRANPHQPRKRFDEASLAELAASIKEVGLVQPILVTPAGDGYQIVAGERRWRAAQLAGLDEVPVIVREVGEQEAFALALIENLQRVDLDPIEEATGYQRLATEYGLTQEQIAQAVGKDRATVANLMRLLKLPQSVQRLVSEGKLPMGHARVLVGLADPAKQIELANLAVEKDLSTRQMESLGRAVQRASSKLGEPIAKTPPDPNERDLIERLKRRFGTKVRIAGNPRRRGKIILEYYSSEEFDRIIEQLLG